MILYADIPGERLDAFLSRSVEDLSRSAAPKLLEEGCVKRNGKPGKKNDRLEPGDAIDVTIPEPKPLEAVPTKMDLEIAYEDEDVLVINKPKGLVVHPAAGHEDDTLVNGLLYARGDSLSGINGVLRPGIVHRIDKDTSGLLAIAKNDLAHSVLAEGPYHVPDLRRDRLWESEGRYRYGGCAHRAKPLGPEENVRHHPEFQARRDPL